MAICERQSLIARFSVQSLDSVLESMFILGHGTLNNTANFIHFLFFKQKRDNFRLKLVLSCIGQQTLEPTNRSLPTWPQNFRPDAFFSRTHAPRRIPVQ